MKDFNYIDAHAHLNFENFANDREEIIRALKKQNAGAINIGVDLKTSRESLQLAAQYENIWATAGYHPTEADVFSPKEFATFVAANKSELVAIGECGLDYYRKKHRSEEVKKLQKTVFTAQIELAIAHDLPLILHLRPQQGSMDAYEDGLEILESYAKTAENLRGTAHFFVGDTAVAERFLALGFYLSATGPVTFDEELQNVFAGVPPEHLLVETDAPFAAPKSHRGQRNSPLYIPDIIATLAELQGLNSEQLAPIITANSRRLFDL